jgi:hypothetical protein
LIQKSIHADSIISKSNSTANLRRLFQHYRPKADMTPHSRGHRGQECLVDHAAGFDSKINPSAKKR